MARINLLPWREELRKQKQQQFAVVTAGVAVVGALLVLLTHMQFSGLIEKQSQRNQFLDGEIAALDEKIKKIKDLEKTKTALLARMNIIQQLQHSRPQSVHLMDQLVLTLPDGLYLKKITQKGNALTLSGSAQSNARVSAYMRNIDSSEWMAKPRLEVIKTKDDENRRSAEFVLRASQSGPAKTNKTGEGKS
ncbi:Type IV pilus biogenesis protein PilN [hydrothermal vent metagenome]|uniref:Type IV pilus biogenesis protein PilN n=1 Tax=hydrothermal vent metagenome TaxID=652676 RepID=A0A3B0ZG80_9ZZZZ